MNKCTDPKFWLDLTKTQILHLLIDGGVENIDGLNRTVAGHEESRKKGFEPCYECKQIARKLGMIED